MFPERASWFLIEDEAMGGSRGPAGGVLGSAGPCGGAECRGQAQSPAFAPDSSEVAAGVLIFLYLVQNLPRLLIHSYF